MLGITAIPLRDGEPDSEVSLELSFELRSSLCRGLFVSCTGAKTVPRDGAVACEPACARVVLRGLLGELWNIDQGPPVGDLSRPASSSSSSSLRFVDMLYRLLVEALSRPMKPRAGEAMLLMLLLWLPSFTKASSLPSMASPLFTSSGEPS